LKDAFLATEQIIESFNAGNQSTAPNFQAPRFPRVIDSDDDLARIGAELSRIDRERQQLKESIVSRFETFVKSIEEKLHAYAAVLQSSPSPTPATAQNLISNATPTPKSREESLFLFQLGTSDANERSANLKERKEFLKVLAMRAENADNRVILGEAADQLERLAKLLPERFNASTAAQPDTATASSKEPRADGDGKVLPSERVARQLEQLRGGVRQMLLTSWSLDDALEQAVNLDSAEREKYREAILAQINIWLSAASRIVIGLLATGLVSLLIVVFGDLVQTQLDTATSSGAVADAINALRGSVAHVSDPAQMTMAGEDWPAEGGS
jgi:hypothetical protein